VSATPEETLRALIDAGLVHGKVPVSLSPARQRLYDLMSGLSEQYEDAGWHMGLEYHLWAAVTGDAECWLDDAERDALRYFSEMAEGWWTWDECRGPVFLSMADWIAEYDKRKESAT